MSCSSHAQGVDLNCGCPQRWAIAEGIGCNLIEHIDLLADIIAQTRARCSSTLTVSLKIRLKSRIIDTIELCRRAEHAGASFITVHGRTRSQRSSDPVNLDAIRQIKDSVGIPVFANGDCKSLTDAIRIADFTGVDGMVQVYVTEYFMMCRCYGST